MSDNLKRTAEPIPSAFDRDSSYIDLYERILNDIFRNIVKVTGNKPSLQVNCGK